MGFLEAVVAHAGIIFMVGGFIFFPPLVKAIIVNRQKKIAWPLLTTLPTAAVLWVYTFMYFAMEVVLPGHYFWLSLISGVAVSAAWSWLLIQSIRG